MSEQKQTKPHFLLGRIGKAEPFTSTNSGGGKVIVPAQDRQQHGSLLLGQLKQLTTDQKEIHQEAQQHELNTPIGIQIEFESFPGIELAVESLANEQQHIELLNVVHRNNKTFATIFVPEGKLDKIEQKIRDYQAYKKNKNGKALDNQKLIDAIESFKKASLEALWADDLAQLPANLDAEVWWEVWLPTRNGRQTMIADFTSLSKGIGIEVGKDVLNFPEYSVLLAKGSRRQFARSTLLLNTIAELRKPKETAEFFDSLSVTEQREWSNELLARTQFSQPSRQTPYICILDTGVNVAHPLLQSVINSQDTHVVEPDWLNSDENGHGTGMAGLATWGDLTDALASNQQQMIRHRLESVKALRQGDDNQGKNLGAITIECVSRPEITAPKRQRIFTMALSSTDGRDRGQPSAWSATIDLLTSDYFAENEKPRLMLICAGNSCKNREKLGNYPDFNLLADIHDPGQTWNGITVGAYTEKTTITIDTSYKAVANAGGLSPFSSTSVTWQSNMPIKPEVVFEGGNTAQDKLSKWWNIPDLSLLTTHQDINTRLFSTFNATSAATALASRFAAQIYAQYPELWPETVRALMIHSAEWTSAMLKQFKHGKTKQQQAKHLVRLAGFGVPNLERALWSANNSLAMIVEDQLQPFYKEKSNIKTKDMHWHDLPWPTDKLLELGEAEVVMTVTLSYFIEPNPSSRGAKGKYSYPSYGLRFDVKRATEDDGEFRKRINRQAQDEDEDTTNTSQDPDWLLGSKFRHKGSIHKDVWTGTAADLAQRGKIAVYPSTGWWKTRSKLGRHDKLARYALIVSISVPEVDVDIYSEIENEIRIKHSVDV